MKEALKLALEALEKSIDNFPANVQHKKAITAIKEALAQDEQEPVAHVYLFDHEGRPRIAFDNAKGIKRGDKLYTTPPKRPWVGLTDEDMPNKELDAFCRGARWADAKLKEKNK